MTINAAKSHFGTTLPVAVGALLFLALLALTAANYASLPERMPVHFDFSGEPNGLSDKSTGAWFLPAVAVVMNLIFWGSAWVVRNKPAWVNVPRKAEFVALSSDARAPVTAMLARFLAWMAVLVLGLFIFIQAGMFAVALGAWKKLPGWPLFGVIGVFVVYIVVMYVRISRAIRRATEAASGSAATSSPPS